MRELVHTGEVRPHIPLTGMLSSQLVRIVRHQPIQVTPCRSVNANQFAG